MTKMSAKYLGDLRVECRHEQSGEIIITDAPLDNNGKGQAFSPTDLCATAAGACAMTIMGIAARQNNIDLTGARLQITKEMKENPRRIGKIEVVFSMPDRNYTDEQKAIIEQAASAFPMRESLAASVEQIIKINWAH